MIYEESQARFHWCHKALVISPQTSASPINRTAQGFPPGTECLGSKCAVWEWVDPYTPKHGYCGLIVTRSE